MSIELLKNEELVKLIQNGTDVTENMQQLIRYIKKNKTVRIPEHTHSKIREYKKAVQDYFDYKV